MVRVLSKSEALAAGGYGLGSSRHLPAGLRRLTDAPVCAPAVVSHGMASCQAPRGGWPALTPDLRAGVSRSVRLLPLIDEVQLPVKNREPDVKLGCLIGASACAGGVSAAVHRRGAAAGGGGAL